MRPLRCLVAVGAVLLAAGCGADGGAAKPSPSSAAPSSAAPSTSGPTSAAPAPTRDSGPVCDGDPKPAGGLHVLRGGSAVLPGGRRVTYADARADGTKRTAALSVDGARQTVGAHQQVTLGGSAYTVAEICTYRVVLTAPGKNLTNQGDHMATWPTTNEGRWRLRWHVPDNGPSTGVVADGFTGTPATCSISVVADRSYVAQYRDLTEGDTVEIAGRLWKVAAINTGRMDVEVNSPDFTPGYVDLRQLGDA